MPKRGIGVIVSNYETLDKALKRFKKMTQEIIKEYRSKSRYTKPSEKRYQNKRVQKLKARKQQKP